MQQIISKFLFTQRTNIILHEFSNIKKIHKGFRKSRSIIENNLSFQVIISLWSSDSLFKLCLTSERNKSVLSVIIPAAADAIFSFTLVETVYTYLLTFLLLLLYLIYNFINTKAHNFKQYEIKQKY